MLVPLSTAADITPESDKKLSSADDTVYHEMRKPFVIPNNISKESFEFKTFFPSPLKSAYLLIRDEVS